MFPLNFEKIFFIIIATLLLAIQWVVIYYSGVKGLIVYCLIFSFIVASFARLMFLWGKSLSTKLSLAKTWLPFIISFTAISLFSVGPYYLVLFSQTGVLNTTIFFPWLALLLGGPLLYYSPAFIKRYLTLRNQARNCIAANVRIGHAVDLPIYIDKLRFLNSINGRELIVPIFNYRDDSRRDDDKQYSGLAQRIQHAERVIFFGKEYIPAGADKFRMSWYSFMEDKYYHDEFPFSFDGYPLRTDIYDDSHNKLSWNHLHQHNAGTINIRIHPHGNVSLYRYSDMLFCYISANTKKISVKEKNYFISRFIPYGQFSVSMLSDLSSQDKGIAEARLAQREIIFKQAINWCMRLESVDVNNLLDIDDVAYFSYRSTLEELSTPDKRPLPEKIEVMYRSRGGLLPWLFIYLDAESLHRATQLLTSSDNNMLVEFVVTVIDNRQNSIQFFINANGQSVAFNDWETNVNEEHKRKSKQLAKIAKQKKIQFELLNSAWNDVKNKDYEEADKKCQALLSNDLLSNDPEFSQVYFLQAHLSLHIEGAEAYLAKIDYFVEKAGVDKLTLARLHNSTGCVLDDQQRYAEALPYFQKASSIEPDDGMYLANIAELHYKLKQAKDAIHFAHKAKEKNYESEMLSDIIKNNGVMK